jgi:hypothetical protein
MRQRGSFLEEPMIRLHPQKPALDPWPRKSGCKIPGVGCGNHSALKQISL